MDELDLLLEELALNPSASKGSNAEEAASKDSPKGLDSILEDLISLDSEEAEASPLLQKQTLEKKKNGAQLDSGAKPSAGGKDSENIDDLLGGLNTDLKKMGVHTVPKGHCAACNKVIVGKMVTALGETWHPHHFVCVACKTELSTTVYFEKDGRPYCGKDFEQLCAPRCAYCTRPITQNILTALDQTWHPDHFFCAHCGDIFGDDGFLEKDGKPYCSRDFHRLFAPKCAGCGGSVMDDYLSAVNATWHPECFICTDCLKPFSDGRFMVLDGRPLCEADFNSRQGTLCGSCHQPIVGRCISAMESKFHPEHFVCAFCSQQLTQGIFKEHKGSPYCQRCFNKLFV
nr:leupaxin-like [Nerophis lumbriciformis]